MLFLFLVSFGYVILCHTLARGRLHATPRFVSLCALFNPFVGVQTGPKRCNFCGVVGHLAHKCRKAAKLRGGPTGKGPQHPQTQRAEVKCYNCGQKGHLSYKCPRSAALFCRSSEQAGGERSMEGCNMSRGGSVEGQAVKSILLDTGCSKTLVRRDLVPEGRQ